MIPPWVRGTLLLVVTLAAGIVIGASYERHRVVQPLGVPMDSAVVMRTLDRELSLDAVQRAAVAAILARRQAAIDSTWRTVRPSVRAALDSTIMEIVRTLRPDQRTKLMTLVERAHPGVFTHLRVPR